MASTQVVEPFNKFDFIFSQELALLRNITRTASVVVREDAELLVIEKDVFSKTCPKIFDKELVDKIKFCK